MNQTWAFAFRGPLLLLKKEGDGHRVPSVEDVSGLLGAVAMDMAEAEVPLSTADGRQSRAYDLPEEYEPDRKSVG